ncbi:zinc ribbon domain-containing protein (plasmid) [Natrinema zhouii]|uniref:zinc ribbon domain-containing protein n=1 Tax=Natrinema zhouii TaxID=1710539 RepID=UPI001CFFF7C3|nr:zinc ribbon domain-containing protein [Natrinema zhouii]UHQ98961.1 zinc ribbon domain-containing protein [Natrinema zhouii]
MNDVSIAAVSAYAPRLRIDADEIADAWGQFHASGIDQKAVPEADEDALTMAVEAAERALAAAGRDGSAVAHLALGTTTPPMAEEDLTARLASMLGTPEDVTTRTVTGSTRAGAQALDAALDAGPWGEAVALVVASDCPRGEPDSEREHAAGAGAAAFVLEADGPGTIVDRASHVEPYPGTRFRATGDDETTGLGVTQYDREAFATTLGGATSDLEAALDVDAAAVQSPDGKLPYRAADALGVSVEDIAAADTVSTLGDTGAASPFLGAATAFADGAERLLLAAYGSGAGANAFVVDGAVPVATSLEGDTDLTYAEYLRRRGEITSDEPEGGGAYVSVPSWQRTIPQRHRLVAGRCPNCSTLNFPPDGTCYSCNERPDEYVPVKLPGTGTVEAVTQIEQGGAPPEFVEQQSKSGAFVSAVVALDGPDGEETVSAPTQVLTSGDEIVSVGDDVETTIRRIYTQEGVIRYGFKAQFTGAKR